MDTKLSPVKIPGKLLKVIGERAGNSRCYYAEGSEEEAGKWFEALSEKFKLVSPGGASMFAPVSRAAVHKRLKEGKLTGFFFTVKSVRQGFFGGKRVARERPYGYIVVSECKTWGKELRESREEDAHVAELEKDFLAEPDPVKRLKMFEEYKRRKGAQKHGRKG